MIMNIGSQKAGSSINNYSGGNIVIGAKKRTDDVGSVFIEVPEEELTQEKHEKQKLMRELDWLYTQCNITFYPKDGRYPIEHNARANKLCKPLLDIERNKHV